MSGFMFSKMFGMLEHLTALLATVLVSRHGIPPTRIPQVVLTSYCQRRQLILVQETPAYASRPALIVRVPGNASFPVYGQ
jgi:hypothetical protein